MKKKVENDSLKVKPAKRCFVMAVGLLAAFCVWTLCVLTVDVQLAGESKTAVGFAVFNAWFHSVTGVNMSLYYITDWLGLVPLFVCFCFGFVGLFQLVRRKSLLRVDLDIILLGVYYILVVMGYLLFEMFPINYRPVLINGFLEASYPSSTTLLVLSVMPTLDFQVKHRVKCIRFKRMIAVFVYAFSAFMVVGRVVSGVHWITDVIGSVLLSTGLFCAYKSAVVLTCKKDFKG